MKLRIDTHCEHKQTSPMTNDDSLYWNLVDLVSNKNLILCSSASFLSIFVKIYQCDKCGFWRA